jgi:hypothetical protein
MVGDLLFVFQIVMAWVFSVPQFFRSFQSTEGMTITWPAMCLAFVVVNLLLAVGAYRKSGSRKAFQIIIVYINWTILMGAMMAALTFNGHWTNRDTAVSILVGVAITLLLLMRRKGSFVATLTEPITRGLASVIFKSTPQLYIAYCIAIAGSGAGLAGLTLMVGHITVCTRIVEILIAANQDGWNRHNVGLMISEAGNELTWLVTTVAWLVYR